MNCYSTKYDEFLSKARPSGTVGKFVFKEEVKEARLLAGV
jgi:hypothetical protein